VLGHLLALPWSSRDRRRTQGWSRCRQRPLLRSGRGGPVIPDWLDQRPGRHREGVPGDRETLTPIPLIGM